MWNWFRRLLGQLAEERVFATFRQQANVISASGVPYLEVPQARALVDACDANDLAVLGMDGHVADPTDRSLTARQDLIVDCSQIEAASWTEFRTKANAFAREVLGQFEGERDLVIEFVLWSEAERAQAPRGGIEIDIGTGRPLRISNKMVKLMPRKGWNVDRVADTVRAPARIESTTDRSLRPK